MVTPVVELEWLRWIPFAPAIAVLIQGITLALFRREPSRRSVLWLSGGAILVSLAVALAAFVELVRRKGEPVLVDSVASWLGGGVGRYAFSADWAFRFDALSAVFCFLAIGVGGLVHLYSAGFMRFDEREDAGFQRYFCYLNFFLASVLVLVLADGLPLLFLGWEGVGLAGYLLAGFWYSESAMARAGSKAFLLNRIGDLGLLASIAVLFWAMSDLGAAALSHRSIEASFPKILEQTVPVASWLGGEWKLAAIVAAGLFFAACARCAQLPLHVWLPDTALGPTPASVLIQLSCLSTGVYLVCRFSFVFAASPGVSVVMAWVGAVTALLAAASAVLQNDVRRILAYSSASQLGLVFVALGCGSFAAAIFHTLTHAFAKGALLFGVGVVISVLRGECDVRRMGGLSRGLRWTQVWVGVAVLALVGLPPLGGFFSYDAVRAAIARGGAALPGGGVLSALVLATGALTAFYAVRLFCLVFLGRARAPRSFRARVRDPDRWMLLPLASFALLAAVTGLLTPPRYWGEFFFGVASSDSLAQFVQPVLATAPKAEGADVASGGAALALLALVFGAGLALRLYRYRPELAEKLAERIDGPRRALARSFSWDAAYDRGVVHPLRRFSERVLYRGIDQGLIDGWLLQGGARLVRASADRGLKRLQSGSVQSYAFVMILGAAALTGYLLW